MTSEAEAAALGRSEIAPLPPGPFACILADPPWRFKTYGNNGDGRGAIRHYRTMTLDEIKELPVRDVAAPDCYLWLWVTGPHLRQGFEVLDAWGFKYSGIGLSWAKMKRRFGDPSVQKGQLILSDDLWHMGAGYTTRKNAELCLIARRGSPKRIDKGVRELIVAPVREHSRKPDEAHERIERMCAGPRLEMFARGGRPGWTVWGNETDKFGA